MIALFIGRFQPFHNGHLKDIKDCLGFSDKIIIGIGSSQESNTHDNPFSFAERKEMIETTLIHNKLADYEIVAIPDINDDLKWVQHVRKIAGEFDVIYTGNEWVKKLFERSGFNVIDAAILKDVNATEIRKRIYHGQNWEELVPSEIAKYIHKISGVNRIKEINGKI